MVQAEQDQERQSQMNWPQSIYNSVVWLGLVWLLTLVAEHLWSNVACK